MKIKTLLVDDEPLALERLRNLLAEDPEIEVVGEYLDGVQAVDAILRLTPDLLFLDIQMPELDGFEVLEALDPEHMPVLVFATAYDQFALKAFQARALDYLLKPFSRQRLSDTLMRAKRTLQERQAYRQIGEVDALLKDVENRPQRCTRFVVRKDERALVIPAKEVEAIEAEANYMWIHRGKDAYPIRGTMASLELRLDPALFFRTHRSWILNIAHVQELLPGSSGGLLAITSSGLRVPVSSSHRKDLEEALER